MDKLSERMQRAQLNSVNGSVIDGIHWVDEVAQLEVIAEIADRFVYWFDEANPDCKNFPGPLMDLRKKLEALKAGEK